MGLRSNVVDRENQAHGWRKGVKFRPGADASGPPLHERYESRGFLGEAQNGKLVEVEKVEGGGGLFVPSITPLRRWCL
ncbi:MAG: hypothetical protein ACP5O1_00500 [Phycisphaerae bacterium]